MSKENMTKSDSNFAPAFVNFNLLSEIHFDAYCLMNNISIGNLMECQKKI